MHSPVLAAPTFLTKLESGAVIIVDQILKAVVVNVGLSLIRLASQHR